MTPEDVDLFSKIVKERSGLVVSPNKAYLLESRLLPVARRHELGDLEALAAAVRSSSPEAILEDITEAMTTNETFFFRDIGPFDRFRENILPPLLENRAASKSLRIWCAAASTGQEPYSLSIILMEMASQLAGWKVEIIGTDISNEALNKAKAGLYSQFEVQRGLPIQTLLKYFTQEDANWKISENIRKMVTYKHFNLLDGFAGLGHFDVVFCRNVLIYFEQSDKAQILDRICKQMPADGSLFLGGAETVIGVTDKFKQVPNLRGVYSPA
ncbi:MAG: protein-glutamate O-methyltransferase CheR [Rhodospirillaceae bacterium]|jgi:chemotaxis protein methyltransferase CheR|nr:protein-glutamate O-methyltransferase CheR [Rhodospirillaceae bacterium]MBT5244589.1 protein-glutamate O-methyltransferase CheR [Rhodospirillaceae bacterium]MBT5563499.1 protein-glutamate O-methyltransferase CheR [Rhodospirillaceae bacterium]MBT6240770.1 protein-glutamate O-methyltransferase CheR [Rhodospirillaceae bacterium]MBT7137776.1 protein-glutamate O-methyltransferase CheR [Rhodospirillaceae bacterium]